MKPERIAERFWSKVDKSGECWVWRGGVDSFGYGRFQVKGFKNAHRWAYVQANGKVPDGLELDHLCRNPKCVRPGHLEAVPHLINILRGYSPQAINARKTQCANGHPFDGTNTYFHGTRRQCRACNREAVQMYAARRKDAA